MHPHGLPAEDCPDWQEGYRLQIPSDSPSMPPDVRRMVEVEYQCELQRMKRHNHTMSILSFIQILIIFAVVLKTFLS